MRFPQDIFRNTKENAIVSSLFYISSVIDKVCTVFTEKRVKQGKKESKTVTRSRLQAKGETSTLQTSKRHQYYAEDISIILINDKMLSGNKKFTIFQLMYTWAYVHIWMLRS